MPIAKVQTKNASGNASASAAAITVGALGVGNTVGIFLRWSGSATLATITDGGGNTYTQDASDVSNAFGDGAFFASFVCAQVANSTTSITFHFGTATPAYKYSFTELSGTSATQPDVAGNYRHAAGVANGANTAFSSNLTPATANAAILGYCELDNQDTSGIMAGTGFTLGSANPTEPGFEAGEYQLGVASGTPIDATFTLTAANGASHTYVGIMAIRPSAGGPPVLPPGSILT